MPPANEALTMDNEVAVRKPRPQNESGDAGRRRPERGGRNSMRQDVEALKRQCVLDEARRLFFTLGYHGTTMDAIADAVDMGKPFLYRHFRNKIELLVALYDHAIALSEDALDRALATRLNADETIRIFVRNYLGVVVTHRDIVAIFFRESLSVPPEKLLEIDRHKANFDQKLTAVIRGGIEAGSFRVSDARVAAFAVVGMINWSYQWYRESGSNTPAELGEMFGDFALGILKSGRVERAP
ncbi:MAG TPA: hypothetical protein DDZ81_01760 [Acetobacteraceae bacterium]|nr:hypothetical protein [Acetobacteraceae bacterium]